MSRRTGHAKGVGRGPSQRQLRVGELIRQILSDVFARREINDPDLEDVILTVSEVRPSPDLRHATVFVSPLGVEDDGPILSALARHRKFLRGVLGKQLDTKFTPDLRFERDESFRTADRVEAILRSDAVRSDTHRDDDEGHEDTQDDAADSEPGRGGR